jgi:hypothetical protein
MCQHIILQPGDMNFSQNVVIHYVILIAKFAKSHEKRLQDHINIEASRLLNVNDITRRLKRKKPFELVIR